MIKGNESDVRNIDFELQLQKGIPCFCFIGNKLLQTLQPGVHLLSGLDQIVAFLKSFQITIENRHKWLIPLDQVTNLSGMNKII